MFDLVHIFLWAVFFIIFAAFHVNLRVKTQKQQKHIESLDGNVSFLLAQHGRKPND